ncbi:MAG TPA: hypothetical protein VKM35_05355 [Arenimonas sp.]|nr:hypothetical protein [Arenimonas sp.]
MNHSPTDSSGNAKRLRRARTPFGNQTLARPARQLRNRAGRYIRRRMPRQKQFAGIGKTSARDEMSEQRRFFVIQRAELRYQGDIPPTQPRRRRQVRAWRCLFVLQRDPERDSIADHREVPDAWRETQAQFRPDGCRQILQLHPGSQWRSGRIEAVEQTALEAGELGYLGIRFEQWLLREEIRQCIAELPERAMPGWVRIDVDSAKFIPWRIAEVSGERDMVLAEDFAQSCLVGVAVDAHPQADVDAAFRAQIGDNAIIGSRHRCHEASLQSGQVVHAISLAGANAREWAMRASSSSAMSSRKGGK